MFRAHHNENIGLIATRVSPCTIEEGIKKRGLELAALLDIDGAFSLTTGDSICIGARGHSVSKTVFRWMRRLLRMRRLKARWKHCTRKGSVGEGCPQGE